MARMEIGTCVVGEVLTNCYLAKNKETGEVLIIDPGGQPARIFDALEKFGGSPVGILLTHGHFDHILAVNPVKEKFEIPVYACSAEEEMLLDSQINMSNSHRGGGCVVKADVLLEDSQEFELAGFSIRCLHTPGHTVGSCCYYVEEEGILFSGDTLFRCSVGRTDFPGGSTQQIISSLHRLLDILPEETIVFPGHDEPTKIGYEKRYNPFV